MASNSKEVVLAHEAHTQLVQVIKISKQSFIVMGKLLHDIFTHDRYKLAVGTGVDTWADYIGQPEIGLTKSDADRLIQIYEQFVERLGFSEEFLSDVPVKHMHYLLPIAKEGSHDGEMEEMLESAKNLSQKDFRDRIQDIKHGEDGERTYQYMIMKKCNETGRITKEDIESEVIKLTFNLDE